MRYQGSKRALCTPFQLELGQWVAHDTTLRPPHRRAGWDDRCSACSAAKRYVKSFTVERPAEV